MVMGSRVVPANRRLSALLTETGPRGGGRRDYSTATSTMIAAVASNYRDRRDVVELEYVGEALGA